MIAWLLVPAPGGAGGPVPGLHAVTMPPCTWPPEWGGSWASTTTTEDQAQDPAASVGDVVVPG